MKLDWSKRRVGIGSVVAWTSRVVKNEGALNYFLEKTSWLWKENGHEDKAFWLVVCLAHIRFWDICIKNPNKFGWPRLVWYIQCLWHVVKWVGCDRETNKEHDKDCIEEGFQLARAKLNRSDEGDRVSIRMGWSAHTKLAWFVSWQMVQCMINL